MDEHMTTGRLPLKLTDAAAVAEFSGKVRSALGNDVCEMGLFGSKATGRDTHDSDRPWPLRDGLSDAWTES